MKVLATSINTGCAKKKIIYSYCLSVDLSFYIYISLLINLLLYLLTSKLVVCYSVLN